LRFLQSGTTQENERVVSPYMDPSWLRQRVLGKPFTEDAVNALPGRGKLDSWFCSTLSTLSYATTLSSMRSGGALYGNTAGGPPCMRSSRFTTSFYIQAWCKQLAFACGNFRIVANPICCLARTAADEAGRKGRPLPETNCRNRAPGLTEWRETCAGCRKDLLFYQAASVPSKCWSRVSNGWKGWGREA